MIPTRKRLLVDVFLTRRLSKSLAFCEFVSVNFEPWSSFKFAAAKDWNHLPKELREPGSMSSFKMRFLSTYWNWIKSSTYVLLNIIFSFLDFYTYF